MSNPTGRRLRVRILRVLVGLVGPGVVAPAPAHSQEGFTPERARGQLEVLLSELGDWHGLALSRYGQSAWSLLRNGSGGLTLLAQDSALAGHEVRLDLRTADLKANDEAGYRVHIRDPQGEAQFDLHLHDGAPGAPGGGHAPVLCPDEAGVGCLDIHGSGDGRAFEAAWSSNGELRWLVAYQDTHAHVDSVLGVGRSSEDRTFERAVLSLSGGISYGSYQAGVNWAMIDMLKRLKYGDLSRRMDSHDFSNLSLAAATGASAGNINALFSALEWCDRDFIPPERSLFFRTWANIGFTQLLPEAHYREHSSIRDSTGTALPDSALFTRRFFKAVPFRSIEEKVSALSAGQARNAEDCNTPVGVTLTKLLPGSLHLGLPPDTIPIDTQRYTTVFELRTADFQGGRANVGFAQPDSGLFQDRTIGKWMLIDTPSPEISVLDVLSIVEAASAYPVAFAPITLSYVDDDLGDDCSTLRGGRCVREGQFMDGGIFDNNPLAVAFALLRRQQTRSDPSDVATQLDYLSDLLMNRVFYIDPGRTRGELRTLEADRSEDRIFGLDVLKEMIKGGIPTARKYELQSVARFGSIVDQSWIRVTDRAAPVFGQSLGAFGAFLGRPLRVHDFYVGAYDGMRMVAREALCNPAANTTIGFAPNLAVEAGPSRSVVDRALEYDAEQCLALTLDNLITQSDSIPSHGRLIMADGYRRDFPVPGGPAVKPPEAHTSAPHDRIAAATLLAAEALKTAARNSSACGPDLRVFDRLLCKEGITAAAQVLRPHLEAVPMATGQGNPKCDHNVAAVEIMADECVADDWFVNFVRSPGQATSNFVERLMRQLWRVQNTYDSAEVGATETWIELPEFYYRSVIEPQYRELGALPRLIHTLPGKPERKATPLYFMPEEISALSQNNGWRLQVAKQAGWDWGPKWVTPITLAYQHGFGAASGTQLESRLGLARKGTGIFLPRWGLDAIWGWDYETDSQFYGAQLDFYLAAGKFHIAPRWVDWPDRDFDWLPRQVAFGLSDVSGMIYWLARLGIF